MPWIGRSALTSTPPSARTMPIDREGQREPRPPARQPRREPEREQGDEDRVDVDDHAGQRGRDGLDPRVVRPGIPRVDRSERQRHRQLPTRQTADRPAPRRRQRDPRPGEAGPDQEAPAEQRQPVESLAVAERGEDRPRREARARDHDEADAESASPIHPGEASSADRPSVGPMRVASVRRPDRVEARFAHEALHLSRDRVHRSRRRAPRPVHHRGAPARAQPAPARDRPAGHLAGRLRPGDPAHRDRQFGLRLRRSRAGWSAS